MNKDTIKKEIDKLLAQMDEIKVLPWWKRIFLVSRKQEIIYRMSTLLDWYHILSREASSPKKS